MGWLVGRLLGGSVGCRLVSQLLSWLVGQWVGRSFAWSSVVHLMGWLVHLMSGSSFGSWAGRVVSQSVICSVVQTVYWSVCHLFSWSVVQYVCRSFMQSCISLGHVVVGLIDLSFGWLTGWLVVWLLGWLKASNLEEIMRGHP